MRDPQHERIQREVFLAAFGANVGSFGASVTDRLTALLEEQVSLAGQTLFRAGDPPEFYYFLREGSVELVREGSAPWTYQGPSVFGLSDALLERPRRRTAVALTDVQAMKVQADAWIEILEDSFALARGAVLGSLRTVAELEQRLWAGALAPAPEPKAAAVARDGDDLDPIERLAVLVETPLLRGAGVQILSDLAAASAIERFRAGEILIERGRAPGRVMLLLDGEVEATRTSPDVCWRGAAGDIVCGTAAFSECILAWEVRARAPGRALTFRIADWLDLMEEHFDMVRATLATLSLDREQLLERLR